MIFEIYNSYIVLKDALVASNYAQTKEVSKVLEEQLKAYKGCENTALIVKNIGGEWFNEISLFEEGEAYYIQVSESCQFTYSPENETK